MARTSRFELATKLLIDCSDSIRHNEKSARAGVTKQSHPAAQLTSG